MIDPLAYDPPDYDLRPTARGLLRLWRDEWRLASLGLGYALAYSACRSRSRSLVQRAIDDSIVPTTCEPLWP